MKGGSVYRNIKTKCMELFDCFKNGERKYKESPGSKFVSKNDRRYFNLKNEKNKNITVVLYTMDHVVHFQNNIVNRSKNNIDLST